MWHRKCLLEKGGGACAFSNLKIVLFVGINLEAIFVLYLLG